MKVRSYYLDYDLYVRLYNYESGNLCIQLVEKHHEPFCYLTVNFPYVASITKKDLAFVDVNNFPEAEEFIRKYELGEPVGLSVQSGYCTYPLYKFNMKRLKEEMLK